MTMRLNHNFQKTYSTTVNRAVGVTTETGVRGALPEPAPDDTNAIWLAPNGNDGSAGTQAAPKLTLNGAITALTVAKPTVQIFRNSYIGDLEFTESADRVLPAGRNIQVEEGEIGIIIFDSDFSLRMTATGTYNINGIEFRHGPNSASGNKILYFLTGLNIIANIENCSCNSPGFGEFGKTTWMSIGFANYPLINIRYCFSNCMQPILYSAAKASDISNNVLSVDFGTYYGLAGNSSGIHPVIEATTLATSTVENNYIVGYEAALWIDFLANPTNPGHVQNYNNNLFFNNTATIKTNVGTAGYIYNIANFDQCLFLDMELLNLLSATAAPTGFDINISNTIDNDTPLGLVNESSLLNDQDLDSSRLQWLGKSTPDGSSKYFLDSALINIISITLGSLSRSFPSSKIGLVSFGDVTEAPDGSLYIVATNVQTIYHTDPYGNVLNSFLTTAVDAGATSPRGCDYDQSDDTLWFCDRSTDKFYNVTLAGSSISTFDHSAFAGGATDPRGVCVDRQNNTLWIVDTNTDRVYNVTRTGTLISNYLTSVIAVGTTSPESIVSDDDGTLWFADSATDRLYNIEKDGTLIDSFPVSAYNAAALTPTGIAVSRNPKQLIISDDTGGLQTIYFVSKTGLIDLNPWAEFTILLSELYDRFVDLDWVPSSMDVASNHINPINNEDVRGNLETDYDSIRRVFSFGYGDSIHISNNQIKKLNAMNSDKGSKEFYPLGLGGNMFDIDSVSSGIFSSTDNSLQPSGVLIDMAVDHWRGFWVTMGLDKYYVNSNDETKMYLVDKRGAGFPDTGAKAFIIEMILINTEKGSFTFTQSNFTEFLKGGSWREDPDEIRNYDYTLDNLDLKEIEDDKENL